LKLSFAQCLIVHDLLVPVELEVDFS
jgi:hypothetical protein